MSKEINDVKAERLMEVLHELKHGDFEIALKKMYKYFPYWREVECYHPEKTIAFKYLFDVVLKEENKLNSNS